MKILFEQGDFEELNTKIRNRVQNYFDENFERLINEKVVGLISNDILFRKEIHEKIMELKKFEIDELNTQFEEAFQKLKSKKQRITRLMNELIKINDKGGTENGEKKSN